LLRKHPDTFSVPVLVPALLLVGIVLGPFFALFSPWLAAGYAATLALYFTLIVGASIVLGARAREARLLAWLPLVFAAIHGGAGAGVLLEWVAAKRYRRPSVRLQDQLTSRERKDAGRPRPPGVTRRAS
jgi:hypothetical protein